MDNQKSNLAVSKMLEISRHKRDILASHTLAPNSENRNSGSDNQTSSFLNPYVD